MGICYCFSDTQYYFILTYSYAIFSEIKDLFLIYSINMYFYLACVK